MPLDVKKIWDACGEAFDRFTSAGDSFSANVERPAIEELLGPLAGARVLDLGCGSGRYSAWLASFAARVTGVDLSSTMISLAASNAKQEKGELDLCVADIRRPLPFGSGEFDLVFSATALHYVEDLGGTMSEAARVLNSGGRLIASVLHPMSTALFAVPGPAEPDDPALEDIRYFGAPERVIRTPWVGFGDVPREGRLITCRHHTISDYFAAVVAAGMRVTSLREPAPAPEFKAKNPERYEDAMRIPVFLVFSASPDLSPVDSRSPG